MLIRLMSDGKNNPEHADKLISIEGLPEEWIFDRRKDFDERGNQDERLFLKAPWEVDVTDNLPEDIRSKFAKEPYVVWFESPQEIKPGTYSSPEMCWIRWFQNVYGFRLNLQTNHGIAMWDQIVSLLDRETPRSQRIPEAAVVGNKLAWTLRASQVPHVKLSNAVEQPKPSEIISPAAKPIARPDQYPCRICGDVFDRERGRWMHERRKHAVKDPFIPQAKEAVA